MMRRKSSRPCPSRQVLAFAYRKFATDSHLLFEMKISVVLFTAQGILTLEATNGNVHVVKNEYQVGMRGRPID